MGLIISSEAAAIIGSSPVVDPNHGDLVDPVACHGVNDVLSAFPGCQVARKIVLGESLRPRGMIMITLHYTH